MTQQIGWLKYNIIKKVVEAKNWEKLVEVLDHYSLIARERAIKRKRQCQKNKRNLLGLS